MIDNVGDDEIRAAVQQLAASLGLKDDESAEELLKRLENRDTQGCVQEIATRLRLPVRIDLSYISSNFKAGDSRRFETSYLSRTDGDGHGVDGITAQVDIPRLLPVFGSPELNGYVIRVRVSENCGRNPHSFVTIMAHELSHVLLGALWHPMRDSELHTDLVPLLMGFRQCVRSGRRVVTTSVTDSGSATETTTYGYLTDSQFECACRSVQECLSEHLNQKEDLLRCADLIRMQIRRAEEELVLFRTYLGIVDSRRTRRMKESDARQIVALHEWNRTGPLEAEIAKAKLTVEGVRCFAEGLNHYTGASLIRLKECKAKADNACQCMSPLLEAVESDLKVLQKHIGLAHRFGLAGLLDRLKHLDNS